jgi:hypothetical protein
VWEARPTAAGGAAAAGAGTGSATETGGALPRLGLLNLWDCCAQAATPIRMLVEGQVDALPCAVGAARPLPLPRCAEVVMRKGYATRQADV